MTEKEYRKWCKQFKRKTKKECRKCHKAHNGVFGILCEHCVNDWQSQVNNKKLEVLKDE